MATNKNAKKATKVNIASFRDNLINSLTAFQNSKKEDTDVKNLSTINRTSNTIIRSAKIELEYKKQMGDVKPIEFLEG